MDKKTKLWLGAGIVGVGAYLLWKSKKATTPVVAAPAKASLVGFNAVGERMIAADGEFAGVGDQEKFLNFAKKKKKKGSLYVGPLEQGEFLNQDGSQFFDVKGGHVGIPDADVFKKAVGEKMPLVGKEKVSPRTKFGTSTTGDNRPKELVGANGLRSSFFAPQTAKFGQNQGIFAAAKRKATPVMAEPIRKTPVEPVMPVSVTQAAPKNNMVGLINGPAVHGTNW